MKAEVSMARRYEIGDMKGNLPVLRLDVEWWI